MGAAHSPHVSASPQGRPIAPLTQYLPGTVQICGRTHRGLVHHCRHPTPFAEQPGWCRAVREKGSPSALPPTPPGAEERRDPAPT